LFKDGLPQPVMDVLPFLLALDRFTPSPRYRAPRTLTGPKPERHASRTGCAAMKRPGASRHSALLSGRAGFAGTMIRFGAAIRGKTQTCRNHVAVAHHTDHARHSLVY